MKITDANQLTVGKTYILEKPIFLGTLLDAIPTVDNEYIENEGQITNGLALKGEDIVAPAGATVKVVGIVNGYPEVIINDYVDMDMYIDEDLPVYVR